MNLQNAQELWNAVFEEYESTKKSLDEMTRKITASFADPSSGGPTEGLIELQRSMVERVEKLEKKMDAITECLRD